MKKKCRHVLIVDDDEVTRKSISRVLMMDDYMVSCTDSGCDALQIIADNINSSDKVDLVITDLMMPKMSGDVLVREIKRIDKKLRIIVITAHPYNEMNLMIGEEKLEILEKPFGVARLIDCINKRDVFL